VADDQPAIEAPMRDRWMSLLQKWGTSPREAHDFVERLIEAAGPHRVARPDDLFTYKHSHWRLSGATKIAWLEEQARQMKADPLYWPRFQTRRTKAAADVDVVLKHLQSGIKTTAYFVRRLRKSRAAVGKLLDLMVTRGDIDDAGLSKWGLPGSNTYAKVTLQVLKAVIVRRQNPTELRLTLGLSKYAIASAIESLRRMGLFVAASTRRGSAWTTPENGGPPMRGGPPLDLTPETWATIKGGEAIRTRRGTILLSAEQIAAITANPQCVAGTDPAVSTLLVTNFVPGTKSANLSQGQIKQ
jgi:hypothetical protein